MKKALPVLTAALIAVIFSIYLVLSPVSVPRAVKSVIFPQASPEASAKPEPTAEELARGLLSGMTAEQKAWQLLYVFPQDITGDSLSADEALWSEKYALRPAGGVILNGSNMDTPEQVKALTSAIASSSGISPFIGVDEEGGAVARLAYTLGVTTDLKPMFTYRSEGEDGARANALTIGSDIKSFGFNQDFAPVADVWTNKDNTVIGKRAYSDDPDEAAKLVAAAVGGFTDAGVISTLKHFPGHGDTSEDSHYSAAHSEKTESELFSCELKPFYAGIEAGAGMVMTGHITMDAIDPDTPATLSRAVVTGILRDKLGFDGVVITDSFTMQAISDRCTQAEAAVMAIEAGCDMILGTSEPDAVAEAIAEGVSPERLDESVMRVLLLKLSFGLAEAPSPDPDAGQGG